jgi:hypothetical protein
VLRDLYGKVMDVAGLNRVQTISGGDYAVTTLSSGFADPHLAPAHLRELFQFRDGKGARSATIFSTQPSFLRRTRQNLRAESETAVYHQGGSEIFDGSSEPRELPRNWRTREDSHL